MLTLQYMASYSQVETHTLVSMCLCHQPSADKITKALSNEIFHQIVGYPWQLLLLLFYVPCSKGYAYSIYAIVNTCGSFVPSFL